jgi:hypothetical protein
LELREQRRPGDGLAVTAVQEHHWRAVFRLQDVRAHLRRASSTKRERARTS